jgi:hypothetical protein
VHVWAKLKKIEHAIKSQAKPSFTGPLALKQIPGNTFLYRPLGSREFQSDTFQSRARGLGDQRLEMVSLCHTHKTATAEEQGVGECKRFTR